MPAIVARAVACAATGTRYLIQSNAAVMTYSGANPNYFPGSAPGSTATGGQYV